MHSSASIDPELIRKYGGGGPRYESYPTADRFIEAFDANAYAHWLQNRTIGGFNRPLELYLHVPLCRYFAGSRALAHKRREADEYLARLGREAAMVASLLGPDCAIAGVHWGTAAPACLDDGQLRSLARSLSERFDLAPGGERCAAVDPRTVDAGRVAVLAELGFNGLSVGAPDFDPGIGQAQHRLQSVERIESLVRAARRHGFRWVNVDLAYGLPGQRAAGYASTLEQVLDCAPDRIVLCPYARLPARFTARLAEADPPAPEERLELLTSAIDTLTAAGYQHIGMHHYVLPGDDLAVAQREGRLARSLHGYSSAGDADIVGLGVSAAGRVGPAYCENVRVLSEYDRCLDHGLLPVLRGVELTADDLVRRAVMQALTCQFDLSREAISIAHLVDFDTYFAAELRDLEALQDEGLVRLDGDWISVTPTGRFVVHAVCMVFDRFLRRSRERARCSRIM